MENPDNNKKSSKWALWFLAISFLFCITVGICTEGGNTTSSSSSQSSSSAVSGKYLNLTLRDRGYKVEITNNETFDITNLRIRLNGDYVYTHPIISSGVTFDVYYSDFKKEGSGIKFDSRTMSVNRISVFSSQGSAGFTN